MTSAGVAMPLGGGGLAARIDAFAWGGTPIGPADAWPPELRTLVGVMLGSKQPMFTVWGPGLVLLFNDAYRPILGHKERDALGCSFLDVWDEIRGDLAPLVARSFAGESVHMDDITLIMNRDGKEPEAHFAFSYTPVRDQAGAVRGFFCACNETTDDVIAGRRQAFRLDLELKLRDLDDAAQVVATAAGALGTHLGARLVCYGEAAADGPLTLQPAWSESGAPPACAFGVEALGTDAAASLRRGQTVAATGQAVAAPGQPAAAAFVAVPVIRGSMVEAVLFAGVAAARRWSVGEVALIESVATRVSDAARRVRAEQEARTSAASFRSLMRAMPNQVWTATSAGAVDWMNERAADYVGRADFIAAGLGWASLMHAEDVASADERWQAALASGTVYEGEFRLRRADGAYRWHLARAVPDQGAAGQVLRWIGTNTDIDDQKRAELDLAAAKIAAEEANVAKSDFIANMSHELRTPLSAIIGYSEMMAEEMADGCEPAELASDMAKVEGNARHLLGLINDVLDLSKVESGKMDIFIEEFAVEATLREVASTVTSLVAKKNNTLTLDLAPGLGSMRSDVVKLRQIVLNLLGNAAKFTENGVITLRAVRQAEAPDGRCLVFTVEDTGIGMAPEQLEKLFERFAQADASTTRRFGGTGLGLSLSKAFVDLLGAAVQVGSAAGQGSVFTLRFPESFTPPDVAAAAEPLLPATEDEAARDLILVIDDDPDQRALITRFLHREGFRVQVAADGRAGLEQARRLKPRAILLDVMMPGIDGWSVLTELKSDPELRMVPVVMVTATDQRSLAASLGAADYMLKPVDWSRFRDVVSRFRTAQGGILLVEDDFASRLNMRTMLEDDGWSVIEAANGKEGLDLATARHPALVLLDLNMPVVDGFGFLEKLRAIPGCAEVPVVILTARELNRVDRQRLRGASQILNKGDVSLTELADRLKNLGEARP